MFIEANSRRTPKFSEIWTTLRIQVTIIIVQIYTLRIWVTIIIVQNYLREISATLDLSLVVIQRNLSLCFGCIFRKYGPPSTHKNHDDDDVDKIAFRIAYSTSGLVWSQYKCAALWRAVYGPSSTERPLGTTS